MAANAVAGEQRGEPGGRTPLPEECHLDQYAQVAQTAIEGLHHVRAARTALGMDADPAPARGAGSGAGPAVAPGARSGAAGQVEAGQVEVGQVEAPVPPVPVRAAISGPLDQVSRVVRKSERPSRTASSSVTTAS